MRYLRPIGGSDVNPPAESLKPMPKAPIALSIVDSVVFGHDLDFSGDSHFDPAYCKHFDDRAGQASWKKPEHLTTYHGEPGKRIFGSTPGQKSHFSQTVFGHDLGGEARWEEDFSGMFDEKCAGRPSWATSPPAMRRRVPAASQQPLSAPRGSLDLAGHAPSASATAAALDTASAAASRSARVRRTGPGASRAHAVLGSGGRYGAMLNSSRLASSTYH